MFARLSANYFFYFALLGLTSPYLAVYLDGYGFNSRQVGEILAVITITKIFAPSLWATLADKTAKPIFIIRLGAFLALLSFSSLYWFTLYWPITLCLACFTLFWTAILPQLEVHTLNTLKQNNKIYARIRLWGSLGFVVLAIVAGEAISRYGQHAFTTLGALTLLALFISTLLLKRTKKFAFTTNESHNSPSLRTKLFSRNFVYFFIAGLLLQISFGPYYGFFALFLRDLNYSGLSIGLLISLGVFAEVFAFIYMGSLFKRFTVQQLLIMSLIITAMRWCLIPIVADSMLLLALSQLTHAFSFAVYHSASMAFISSHFIKTQRSRAQGIYLGGLYGVGGATGAYLTGILWLDGAGATKAFTVAGIFAFTGAIVILFSKNR